MNRLKIKSVFALAMLCIFLGWANSAWALDKTYGKLRVIEIVSVYDGDTFRCNIEGPPIIAQNIGVRVYGIDTPEIRSKSPETKALALKARDFAARKLRQAQVVELKKIRRGKYFRIVDEVWIDGRNLGKMLLDAGLAKPYYDGRKPLWGRILPVPDLPELRSTQSIICRPGIGVNLWGDPPARMLRCGRKSPMYESCQCRETPHRKPSRTVFPFQFGIHILWQKAVFPFHQKQHGAL